MNQSTKRVQRAWAMYDWANSAYNLVITSTIFPAYYVAVTSVKQDGVVVNDKVNFFGNTFSNTALFDYALAAAYLVIAFLQRQHAGAWHHTLCHSSFGLLWQHCILQRFSTRDCYRIRKR